MKPSKLAWTYILSFLGILGFNLVFQLIANGFDNLLDSFWWRVAIAAGIAALITLGSAVREARNADDQS